MNFSSLIFIFFFLPLFLLCYYATSKKYKHLVLLSGSIIFYAYSGVYNLCILISLSLINYLLVFLFSTKFQHKWAFSLLAILNIAALLLFKYNTNLLFPLGISFYVFNNVSYILDVRKDFKKCEKNFFYFMTYSTCFCHVTMGPLIRYHEFKDCIKESKISFDDASSGFRRFLKGLLKKVLLADNLGLLYGLLVSDLHQSVLMLILTLIVFALQLYLDFSGYCDMAIGLGKMLGIKYPENFDHPYLALSISDFWRKWHITLSAFDTKKESEIIEIVDNTSKNWNKIPLQWVSVGQFMPYVVFLAPVLNIELYSAATELYSELTELGDVSMRNCYKPFQWLPHTTLAKMLTQEEMLNAVKLLHNQFGVIKGTAVRIALAKSNPHMDIAVFDLK